MSERLMDVRIDKNTKTVQWEAGEKTLTIHNEYVLFAFKHGKNMVMIKEKYESSQTGISTYDKDGKIIFSYRYFENQIIFREKIISLIKGAIIAVDYEEDKRKLVVLKEQEEKRTILVYNDNADMLAEINAPKDYLFVSFKNFDGKIMVAAQGMSNTARDLYGRNDWNFSIDLETYYVERKGITQ